jgi:iron complex outermembrane receptor protein
MKRPTLIGFGLLPPLFCFAQQPEPAETLPTVVVTAEQDSTIEQPRQITRITGEELEARSINQLTDLQSEVPNIIARSGGTRSLNSVFGFRGMVNNAYYSEPAATLYVDDVPYGMTMTYDTAMLDVDRIDVFRGPQFTRFGRSGPAGLISMYSREPGDRPRVEGSVAIGDYDAQTYKLSLSSPLTSQFSVSLSGMYSKRDGFLYNEFRHRRPDYEEAIAGRFSFQWMPTPEWKVQLIIAGQRFDDGVQRFTETDSTPSVIDHDFTGVTDGSSDVQALRIRYSGEKFHFTSVTARRDFRLDPATFDLDFSRNPFAQVFVFLDIVQYSQEFRLQSAPGSELNWFLGAYASWTQQDVDVGDPVGFAESTRTDKAFALFGEVSRKFGEHLEVTAGLRGDYVRKSAERVLTSSGGDRDERSRVRTISNFSPKLQLTWHFDDNLLAYVSSALTYRPGVYSGFNANPKLLSADTEQTWANEIGAKARFFDGKLELSVAGFWYEIEDYQLEYYLLSGFGVSSADHVVSRGVELELTARPFEGLELSAAVGYTDVRFTDHHLALTGEDLSGRRPPYIPDVTANFSAQYKHRCGAMARLDWLLTGRAYFNETNIKSYAQNAYGLLNARVGYERDHWGLYLYGKNLADSEYYTLKLFPIQSGLIGEPRTVGVMATFNF